MPKYNWTCHACQATNRADAETCVKCNCPAHATASEIQNAVARPPAIVEHGERAELLADLGLDVNGLCEVVRRHFTAYRGPLGMNGMESVARERR